MRCLRHWEWNKLSFQSESRPDDWPRNGREFRLDCIWDKIDEFEKNPNYKIREVLQAIVSEHDLNQFTSFGLMRFTEYEVELINLIYVRAARCQFNSVKVFLYDLITEATRLQKINSWTNEITGENKEDGYRIKPYEEGLLLQLKLYHFAYQKYTLLKNASFAEQLLSVVNEIFEVSKTDEEIDAIAYAFSAMLNDISYMRGNKKEKLWEFDRDELFSLFELEAKILSANRQNPYLRPTRGIMMTQISNFILKSRNNYNQDYICKYVSKDVAKSSISNHEIWLGKTKNLNDKREQKVIPELFEEDDWIAYPWAKQIDFTPVRTYFVSSYSKSIGADNMRSEYGECLYGYKNDRIVELIGPIMMQTLSKRDNADDDLPEKIHIPAISQVLAFDVLYDRNEAKEELEYLFKVIDLFDMTEVEKHDFLQDILQYWILTVKDDIWKKERERRYVLFLYDGYDYLETVVEDGFLKEKTSLFILPDFIIGDNPVKEVIKCQLEAKQTSTMTKEYLHCYDCLVQDYDAVQDGIHRAKKCPICGSDNIEIIYPKRNEGK